MMIRRIVLKVIFLLMILALLYVILRVCA